MSTKTNTKTASATPEVRVQDKLNQSELHNLKAQFFSDVYCHEVEYTDDDTLSVTSVISKPRETICILLGFKRELKVAKQERDELLAALKGVSDRGLSITIGQLDSIRNLIGKLEGK